MASTITPISCRMREPFQRLPGDARALPDFDFFDLQRALLVHGGIEEIDHVGTHKGLRNAITGEVVGRDHRIGARRQQVLLGIFFRGARDDLQLGIQAARSEDDVDVDGVGGRGRHQALRLFDTALAAVLFACVASPTSVSQPSRR